MQQLYHKFVWRLYYAAPLTLTGLKAYKEQCSLAQVLGYIKKV